MMTLPKKAVDDLLKLHEKCMLMGFHPLMRWCDGNNYTIRKIYDEKYAHLKSDNYVIAFDINYKSLAVTISFDDDYYPIISSAEYYEEI